MKAIGLLSGGLDSALAIALLKHQNIEVIALHFWSPFWKKGDDVRKLTEELGVEFQEVEVDASYLEVVQSPRYGYGKNVNPCIDCKIWMLRQARMYMEKWEAWFVFTGEVLGQRSKSQMRNTLRLIEKQSNLDGLLLRPLSAKLLPETIPEKMGWVKRDGLLGLSGKGRKKQLELAQEWGIKSFFPPAGGCLLTEPNFTRRWRDFLQNGAKLDFQAVELLKIGRHFRLSSFCKLIVGRDEEENRRLQELFCDGDVLFFPQRGKGPWALLKGKEREEGVKKAVSLLAYYVRLEEETVPIVVWNGYVQEVWQTKRMTEEEVKERMI